VTVGGYNHKLMILLQKVLDAIVNFKVDADRFHDVREKVAKDYKNVR
jgi:insulysin